MSRSRHTPRNQRLLELLVAGREGQDVTQTELARRLRKPQSFVSKFEAGERRLDVVELIEVAEALGCPVIEMIQAVLDVAPDRAPAATPD